MQDGVRGLGAALVPEVVAGDDVADGVFDGEIALLLLLQLLLPLQSDLSFALKLLLVRHLGLLGLKLLLLLKQKLLLLHLLLGCELLLAALVLLLLSQELLLVLVGNLLLLLLLVVSRQRGRASSAGSQVSPGSPRRRGRCLCASESRVETPG